MVAATAALKRPLLALLILAFVLVPNEPIMRAPWELKASEVAG